MGKFVSFVRAIPPRQKDISLKKCVEQVFTPAKIEKVKIIIEMEMVTFLIGSVHKIQ